MSPLCQLRARACLSAQGTMPFGKNKKLTMPRAQKTKVPACEDAWEIENETGITGAEEPAPPPATH